MIVLLVGGARSGKSEIAERIAADSGTTVTYIATGSATDDEDFARRIADHQARRPWNWPTVECGRELAAAVAGAAGTLLIDSLGTWVAQHVDFAVEADALAEALTEHDGTVVVVSEEVGLGVHPESEVGRRFRDALGALNRRIATVADRTYLVVAGRMVEVHDPGQALSR